jgi:hypothetical protein
MSYRHNPKPATALSVEQERRRLAQARIELMQLVQARKDLEAKVEAELAALEAESAEATRKLSVAHKHLTRQVRRRDAVRVQAALIAAGCEPVADMPEPVHGGRAGLLAAADEVAAYEARTRRRPKPVSVKRVAPKPVEPIHGTWTMYRKHECRCDECRAWKTAESAKAYAKRHGLAA